MHNSTPPAPTQQTCPQCGAIVPVMAGYKPWCEHCNWNLAVPPPSPRPARLPLHRQVLAKIGLKSSRLLFDSLLHRPPQKGPFTFTRLLAYLIAAGVHTVTLALVGVGLWLCFFAIPNARLLGILLGLACLALVWLLYLPARSARAAIRLTRIDAPILYETANRITARLGGFDVGEIHYDLRYNARIEQSGLLHRWRMVIGLPLVASLTEQEWVALLSHELAHHVNGDPLRGWFTGSAIQALDAWFSLFYSKERWRIRASLINLLILVFNIVCLPLAGLTWLTGYLLSRLLWVENQRAEYLADWLAAQVSGTEAMLGVLDKGLLHPVYENTLKFAYLDRHMDQFYASLKRRIQQTPRREFERLLRIEALTGAPDGSVYPPITYRRSMLEAHPNLQPQLVLSSVTYDHLQQELLPHLVQTQKWLAGLDEKTFRELLNLDW